MILQRLFFSQMSPLVRLARLRPPETSDLPDLPEELSPRHEHSGVQSFLTQSTAGFLFGLVWQSRKYLAKGYFLYAIFIGLNLYSPNLLHALVSQLEKGNFTFSTWLYAAGLALCGIFAGVSLQHYFYSSLSAYQEVTNKVNVSIFSHALRLSHQAKTQAKIGDVVNHIGTDSDAISDFPIVLADLVWCLVMILGVSGMLYSYLGVSAIIPLIIIAMVFPLIHRSSRVLVQCEDEMMNHRDQRVGLMSQILSAIRLVKFNVWEKSVANEVQQIRDQEIKARRRLGTTEIFVGTGFLIFSHVALFTLFLSRYLRGEELSLALIFTSIALFAMLDEPFHHLSQVIARITQASVSVKRIRKFLKQETQVHAGQIANIDKAFCFSNAHISYHKNTPVISNFNLSLNKGESLAIIGKVGTGKSAILYALLDECEIEGKLDKSPEFKKLAFVPQEAFIFNASLAENITFGRPLIKEEVYQALSLAHFEEDLQQLPGGLFTEIGERGVNLSGGQKQRVSLARAYLSRPDVILLDDPLSALDVRTEKIICDRLLFGEWSNKTRVVVTHRLDSLHRFDKILFFASGEKRFFGTLNELKQNCPEFNHFYQVHAHSQDVQKVQQDVSIETSVRTLSEHAKIIVDEDREVGSVKTQFYKDYLRAMIGRGRNKFFIAGAMLLFSLLPVLFPLGQKLWMSQFSSISLHWGTMDSLIIYGLLGIGVILSSALSRWLWMERGIVASQYLHASMFQGLLAAKMRFFDTTPMGRILQRFSRDLESVDVQLQWSFESFFSCLLNIFVSLVFIVVLLPVAVLFILPALYFYYHIQLNYRRCAREVKRLDSIARSPRYAHFKETLQGLLVIRAFDRQKLFIEHFLQKLKHSQRMFYGHYLMNRWFSSRIPVIGGFISLSCLMLIVWSAQSGKLEAGVAALLALYSTSFWGQLNWGIRIFADIESRMTSVERIKRYAFLPPEENAPSAERVNEWPIKGDIVVENLSVRYDQNLPRVLDEVSLKIPGGKKVGLVGRTGSGKTTLFQALYRLVSFDSGDIYIDGVSISKLPLWQLRQSLAIVPQDPILFIGTVRSNLDRYSQHSDEKIWLALAKVGLSDFVKSLPLQLNTQVFDGGKNLSQGQRQLLCFARALLFDARIILMDEATASVDVQTDHVIQKVISQELKGKTLFVIAHRLETLKDCDLIVHMSRGKIAKVTQSDFSVKELGLV